MKARAKGGRTEARMARTGEGPGRTYANSEARTVDKGKDS